MQETIKEDKTGDKFGKLTLMDGNSGAIDENG
jgi:hypothetical protein